MIENIQNVVLAEPEIWTVQLVRAFALTISRIESTSEHLEITTRHEQSIICQPIILII